MSFAQTQSITLFRSVDSRTRKPSKLLATLSTVLSAVEDGFNKAELYEQLARKSDSELAALGVRRVDLPRLVMFAKR